MYEGTLQTNRMYSMLKQRGKGRFNVVSTRNTRSVFVGYFNSDCSAAL